jgi:heat shock protein HslJ
MKKILPVILGLIIIVGIGVYISRPPMKYFGNAVAYDFDKDGREDSAFIMTKRTSTDTVEYYVVARLNTVNGQVESKPLLLGENIAPQTTEMGKGPIVVVNYAVAGADGSVGKSMHLLLDTKTMQFGEVAVNFEGEADPSLMTLTQKSWSWIQTVYNNDTEVKPRTDKFVLTFTAPNTFSATTDCNTMGGQYTVKENTITFGAMFSTKMFCEGSQEDDFSKALGQAQSFHFTGKGELVFDLAYDSGSMIFK